MTKSIVLSGSLSFGASEFSATARPHRQLYLYFASAYFWRASHLRRSDGLADERETVWPPKEHANVSTQNNAQLATLTAREAEVLCLLSKGQPNKIIAHRLDLAESTIKLHIHHIISKLGVSNRTEAAIVFHASSGTVNVREGDE